MFEFCVPFLTKNEAFSAHPIVAAATILFAGKFGSDVQSLYVTYMNNPKTGTKGTLPPRKVFGDQQSRIVSEFRSDPETFKEKDKIMQLLADRVRADPQLMPAPGQSTPLLGFRTVLGDAELLDRPMSFGDPGNRIPGFIAGGPAKGNDASDAGDDVRNVDGKFIATNLGDSTLRIRAAFTFDVFDCVDFCPGASGSGLALGLTIPISKLEATPDVPTYDVPFEVVYRFVRRTVVLSEWPGRVAQRLFAALRPRRRLGTPGSVMPICAGVVGVAGQDLVEAAGGGPIGAGLPVRRRRSRRRSGFAVRPAMTAPPVAWLALLSALQDRDDHDHHLARLEDLVATYPLGILTDPVHDLTCWAKGLRAAGSGDSAGALHHLTRFRLPVLARMSAPERIEAAVRVGDIAAARAWTEELAGFADATGRPWALATVAFGRALTADQAQADGLTQREYGGLRSGRRRWPHERHRW